MCACVCVCVNLSRTDFAVLVVLSLRLVTGGEVCGDGEEEEVCPGRSGESVEL